MTRRTFLQTSLAAGLSASTLGAFDRTKLDKTAEVLQQSVASGQIKGAVLHVSQFANSFTRAFGTAREDSMFLLGSISKPICITALMRLYDRGSFKLDDPFAKFIPAFKGDHRDEVTMKHLLTHTSGLPDQVFDNAELRRSHASLATFVEHATRAPLSFAPGSKFQYSSMGVLLATHVAEIISGRTIAHLVETTVFRPLGMTRSAQGLGLFKLEDVMPVQIEHAAPEAGGGDPTARDWDWNSPWWRKLGAPWGATHCSAPNIGKFLSEFLNQSGAVVKPQTAALMIQNQNPKDVTPWGLGFEVGSDAGGHGCSERTFGHPGSTGTIAWADPATKTICVILTTLPERAVKPHPRDLASDAVAAAVA